MKTKITTTLKELKAVTTAYISQLNTFTRTIRDTYDADIETIKEDLLNRIAVEYSLDSSELKGKFLRKKKKQTLDNNNDDDTNNSDSEYMPSMNSSADKQQLLIKHSYDNNNYYIEMIDRGKVYDSKKNEVGIWINGQMELNMNLITQLKTIESQINDLNEPINKNQTLQPTNNNDDDFCKISKKTPILVPHPLQECASAQKTDVPLLALNFDEPKVTQDDNKQNDDNLGKKKVVRRRITKKYLT